MRQKGKDCGEVLPKGVREGSPGRWVIEGPAGVVNIQHKIKSLQKNFDEARVVKIHPRHRNPPHTAATAAPVIPSAGGSKSTCLSQWG
jgi:hypothetical protein